MDKFDETYNFIRKMYEDCNMYINHGGGYRMQKIVWNDRREALGYIIRKMDNIRDKDK